jgi:hypothetical protein
MYIAEGKTPCQTENDQLWFAKPGTRGAKKAARFCHECPERIKCLESVVKFEAKTGNVQRGIYGGLDMKQRLPLRNQVRQSA